MQESYGGLRPFYDSSGGGVGVGYVSVVYAHADPLATGRGTTKRAAEWDAARKALIVLGVGPPQRAGHKSVVVSL